MAIDPKIVGNTAGPVEFSWTSRDTMLYALGVGAGQADPYSELQYTPRIPTACSRSRCPSTPW